MSRPSAKLFDKGLIRSFQAYALPLPCLYPTERTRFFAAGRGSRQCLIFKSEGSITTARQGGNYSPMDLATTPSN